jgi:hypothetical protein
MAVDVGDLEVERFADSQARAIEGHEDRAVFSIGSAFEQCLYFFASQDSGQSLGLLAEGDHG